MAFKIKDGLRIGTVDVFNNSGVLQSAAVDTAVVVTLSATQTLTNKTLTSPTLTTPALGTPSSGTLTSCTGLPISTGVSGLGTGVATFLATPSSANLLAAVTDETGTGSLVFANSPTLVTPALGTPSSVTLTNATGLPISTGVSGLGTGVSTFLATPSSANLLSALTDETGSGLVVFGTSPSFTTSVTTGSTTFAVFNTTATTINAFGAATSLSIGASTGTTTVNNDLTVTGNLVVNGTTTTVNSTTITVDDISLELGAVASPTDITAAGGGIVLKGTTDKTITWGATNGWTSTETFNLASGKTYKINGTDVLSGSTLGSGVTGSSLTSVGTLSTGTWQATVIGSTYGGTGVNNGGRTITVNTGNVTFTAQAGGSSVTVPSSGTLATTSNKLSDFAATSSSELAGVISDETGSGALVFGTAPTIKSSITRQTSGGTTVAVQDVVQATVATTSATAVDTFSATSYRSVKYLVQVTQGSNYQFSEILVIHNGTTTSMTEYGALETNGALATFTSDISTGNVRLLVTMGSATSATINITKTVIAI